MWIHDRFILLHLQKTAGTSLAAGLRRALPPGSLRRGAPDKLHPGWGDIPSELTERPVLFYVRNPWDWYVSWYHFVLKRQPDNVVFHGLLESGDADFATAVRNACTLSERRNHPQVAKLITSGSATTRLMAQGHDYYTARLQVFGGPGLDSELVTIGRFESLFDDLERFLTTVGVTFDEQTWATLRASERLHVTEHRPYAEYYDDDLRDLVGEACSGIIERFGYEF